MYQGGWILRVPEHMPHQPSQDLMILVILKILMILILAHLGMISCLEFGIMLLPLHLKPVLSEEENIYVDLKNFMYVCVYIYTY